MRKKDITDQDYLRFVAELKSRIHAARMSAARAVNRDLIFLYWDIGRGIVERQEKFGWGESVIDRLSQDLQEVFPGTAGFSARNLRNMKQFYEAYSSPEFWEQVVATFGKPGSDAFIASIWQQPVAKLNEVTNLNLQEILRYLVAEIPWGQHMVILNKARDSAARLFYLHATARFGWSRNVLLNQIKANTYERSLNTDKMHNFPSVLPEVLAEQAEEALKSSYNLEFLGISRVARERELEGRLIERLKDFIMELGYGFCFIGRQHRLTLGQKEYFLDLLFYHRFLKSLVAIELKVGAFEPEYAGKMDFYLNLLNETDRAPDDNPSIGIILCAEKDNLEVEFALKTKMNPIGVAEYQLQPMLPKELKGKLPSPKQLSDAFREMVCKTRKD